MVRLFIADAADQVADPIWSFSYVDWQGKTQSGIGTQSKAETQRLAERVQAEHDRLRAQLRTRSTGRTVTANAKIIADSKTGGMTRASEETESHLSVRAPIGEQLIDAGLVTQAQVEEGLAIQKANGGRLVENLIRLGFMTADKFMLFMGKRIGTPRIQLENLEHVSTEVLQLIPPKMATELEVVPVDRIGKILSVAMVCPADFATLQQLQHHTGLKVRPMLCSKSEHSVAVERLYATLL